MEEEKEVDDTSYVKSKDTVKLSDTYYKYIAWTKKKPFTGTQSQFANWLLEEPQLSKIKQIGGLDTVFSDVRRFAKGMKAQNELTVWRKLVAHLWYCYFKVKNSKYF